MDGNSKGDFKGEFKQDLEKDLLSSSGSALVQVKSRFDPSRSGKSRSGPAQLKFNSFELDTEVELILSYK